MNQEPKRNPPDAAPTRQPAQRQRPLSVGPLRAFEAVARTLSFRMAAEELHLTQSAISRQIRSLEELLGQPLFHRQGRSVALTDAGQDLLETTQQVLLQLAVTGLQTAHVVADVAGDFTTLTIERDFDFESWALPALAGQFISLVKDTSLVSVIAITELTKSGREAITTSFSTFEIWFCVAALYLVINLPLSQIASRLERRLAQSD